jgi:hypothetical protein
LACQRTHLLNRSLLTRAGVQSRDDRSVEGLWRALRGQGTQQADSELGTLLARTTGYALCEVRLEQGIVLGSGLPEVIRV